jgi:hypothetical protein
MVVPWSPGIAVAEVGRRIGRRMAVDRQAGHGAFTAEEIAAARAEIADADRAVSG